MVRPAWNVAISGRIDRACELVLERIAKRSASDQPGAREEAPLLAGPVQPVAQVQDLAIAGPGGFLPLRLYLPEPRKLSALLVWLHGGGFVSGGLESHDVPLRALANQAGCAVLAVDYHLSPAHPYPAAIEDAHAALLWASAHASEWGADPRQLAVGGDSAGGNLAAVAAMLCRDRGGPELAMQILLYPDGDARAGFNQESWRRYDTLVLERREKDRTLDLYLPGGIDRMQPSVSPALSPPAALRGLPPALILTAEFDPQRDEGELYASRLREAGVAVSLTRIPGMIHGFWQMGGLVKQAREVTVQIAAALSQVRDELEAGPAEGAWIDDRD
jgi:acetyl esterase/lipase